MCPLNYQVACVTLDGACTISHETKKFSNTTSKIRTNKSENEKFTYEVKSSYLVDFFPFISAQGISLSCLMLERTVTVVSIVDQQSIK